ncbi:MAG: hypothetical protein WBY94_21150 [Polyangiaceae bacterium]
MALHALVPCPLLYFPQGVIKGPVDCRVHGLGPLVVRPCVLDEDLMPGKIEVDGDVETIPVAVMVAHQLDDDATGNDAVKELLELLGAKPNMGV